MRTLVALMLMAAVVVSAGCRPRSRGAVKPAATAKPVARSAAKPASVRNAASRAKPAKKADKLDPALEEGLTALHKEDFDRAIVLFSQVIKRDGRHAEAYYLRASAYANKEEDEKAMADADKALELDQNHENAYTLRGWLYGQKKDYDHAIEDCTKAIRLNPKLADAFATRASAYTEKKEFAKAIADYKSAVRLDPEDADSQYSLAWVLATCPNAELRSGSSAIEHATAACRLSKYKDAVYLDTLAAAYAESGQFRQAIDWEQKALLAAADLDDEERDEMRNRLEMYQQGKPYRDE